MWYCDIVIVSQCHILSLSLCHWVTLSHLYCHIVMMTLVSLGHWAKVKLWHFQTVPLSTITISHNHTKIVQQPYCVIQSNNETMHHSVWVSISHKIILEHWYCRAICKLLKLSHCQTFTYQCATVAQLYSHTIILSHSLSVKLLHYVTVKLWHCHIITLYTFYTITL